VTSLEANACD